MLLCIKIKSNASWLTYQTGVSFFRAIPDCGIANKQNQRITTSPGVINKLTAIIVDDELFGRENLKKIIENYCFEIEILGCADSVVNAKKLVCLQKPDVVFLDINMPVLDGFDFLEDYEECNFMVVFVSAHEEFGINAVKAGAVDYLLKPINIEELKQTVKKLLLIKNKMLKTGTFHESNKLVLPGSLTFSDEDPAQTCRSGNREFHTSYVISAACPEQSGKAGILLSFPISSILVLLLNPVVMFRMAFVHKVFRIFAVADWLLIALTFK